jgi:CBS domain-containing protein
LHRNILGGSEVLKAKDMMSTKIVSISKKASILEALKVIVEKNITGLPVVQDEKSTSLVGIVSEKDFINLLYGPCDWETETVDSIMTSSPESINEDATVREVCDCLKSNVFRRIPVVSKGKLVGLISRRDITSFMWNRLKRVGDLESFLEQP